MTAYFMGGEDVDFGSTVNNPINNTTASYYRSSYARTALQCAHNASHIWRANNSMNGVTGLSAWWFSAQVYLVTAGFTGNTEIVSFTDSSNNPRLIVRDESSGSNVQIVKKTTAGVETVLATAARAYSWDARHQWVVHVVYGSSGSVTVYVDGSNVVSYTGDVTTNSSTALNGFDLGINNKLDTLTSEIIIADTDLRGASLCALIPSGTGNADTFDGFTGSNATTSINKTTIDDSTYVYANTNAEIEQFTTNGLPVGNFNVNAIKVSTRAAAGVGGPQNIEVGYRSSGTDHWSSDQALNPAFANVGAIFQSSPLPLFNTLGTGFNIGVKAVT